jgi:nucleoside-diphosphate-sugar epimerase
VRIAVTGASGFVGGRVARALAAAGHEVLAYGRRPAAALASPLPGYAPWDVAAAPSAPAVAVDAVVHCAAHVGDWGPEAAYRAVNVDGTRAVLARFPGARGVHVSTSSVYSDGVPTVRVREDAPTGRCAHSPYARTKAEAERVVLAEGSRAVVLRPHIVYGPGDSTLLPRVLAARRLGALPVPGDGRNRVSATHVDNLVHAVERALATPGAYGAFNVADGVEANVNDLLRTLLRRYGVPTRLVHVPRAAAWRAAALCEGAWRTLGALGVRGAPPLTRYAVGHLAAHHTLDTARARDLLGYAPRWSYLDGPLVDERDGSVA